MEQPELIEVGSLEFWELFSPFVVPVSRQLLPGVQPSALNSHRVAMERLGVPTVVEGLRDLPPRGRLGWS